MATTTSTRTRSVGALCAAGLAALSAAVAGCGGGGTTAAASSTAGNAASSHTATVSVANSGLGQILVDSRGRTLYLFKADQGTKSACAGACATAWPPLLVSGKPTAGNGVSTSLVGTATRAEGGTQVTYNGHPLYLFADDHKAGETNGQGVTAFGAAWFALDSAGNQASGETSHSNGSEGVGGGY
jgi:predicted lipoprotein with Yx(FWY)xxD motif